MYMKICFQDDDVQVESVSPGGDGDPVEFTLRADQNEVGEWVGLYALADDGYIINNVEISLSGTTATKWQLAPDNVGEPGTPEDYGDPLSLGDNCDDTTGIPFWIRAKAIDTEDPTNDDSVTISASGVASAE